MLEKGTPEYRQALLSMNYEIESIFRRNLSFFEQRDESIYSFLRNFEPKRLGLTLAEEGYLQLVNLSSGKPVYPGDPLVYAEQQAQEFIEKKPCISLNLSLPETERDDYLYTKALNKLDSSYKSYEKRDVSDEKSIRQLFMFGGGLFLQLQFVLNAFDIKSLYVFESDPEAFYISMHLVDWSEIYKYFDRDGYKLYHMLVGDDAENCKKICSDLFFQGYHNYSAIHTYFHYENEDINRLHNNLVNYMAIGIGAVGFFEDERVGLSHSLENFKSDVPLLGKSNYTSTDFHGVPVFIVANGPSFDKTAEFVKRNQDHAIVVSCGSALSALINSGIRPDIHIEQERMSLVTTWITDSVDMQELEDVTVIGLNPCHPSLFSTFKKRYYALKEVDLGSQYLESLGYKCDLPEHTMPVVANTALSMSLFLGFKNIHLFGVDCGMVDTDHHHSKQSGYYQVENNDDIQLYKDTLFMTGTLQAKGNLRESVYTTHIYNFSRFELEALLDKYRPNCFNYSDGAMIKGAIPSKTHGQIFAEKIDKNKIVQNALEASIVNIDVDEEKLEKSLQLMVSNVSDTVEAIRQELLSTCEISKDVDEVLDNVSKILFGLQVYNERAYQLIFGSVRGICYKLSVAQQNLNEADFLEFYNEFITVSDDFFQGIENQLESSLLSYDLLH